MLLMPLTRPWWSKDFNINMVLTTSQKLYFTKISCFLKMLCYKRNSEFLSKFTVASTVFHLNNRTDIGDISSNSYMATTRRHPKHHFPEKGHRPQHGRGQPTTVVSEPGGCSLPSKCGGGGHSMVCPHTFQSRVVL